MNNFIGRNMINLQFVCHFFNSHPSVVKNYHAPLSSVPLSSWCSWEPWSFFIWDTCSTILEHTITEFFNIIHHPFCYSKATFQRLNSSPSLCKKLGPINTARPYLWAFEHVGPFIIHAALWPLCHYFVLIFFNKFPHLLPSVHKNWVTAHCSSLVHVVSRLIMLTPLMVKGNWMGKLK